MVENRGPYRVVGIGEILWDILPGGKQLGGAPANFAYHALAMGGKGIVVSSVGRDKLGEEVLKRLEELGIDCSFVVVDPDHPTGTVTVELDGMGKPSYAIHEGAAWDFIPLNRNLLNLATEIHAVCFGSLCQRSETSRKTIARFLGETPPQCIRVFDINLRRPHFNRKTLHTLLKESDVLKLNEEELAEVADLFGMKGSQGDILSRLTERYNLRLIALTRGACGSRLYAQGEFVDHPGCSTAIVDTVGAGDSFTAAVTMGLLLGRPLDWISEHANRVASFVCSQRGGTPDLPSSLVQGFMEWDSREKTSFPNAEK